MERSDRTVREDAHPQDDRGALARRLLPDGEEPDPRFSLANERTFLAWVRTALAFIAGGVAVEALTSQVFPPMLRKGVAVAVVLTGAVIALASGWRWLRVERSMRTGRPLPVPGLVPVLCLVSAIGGVVTTAVLLGAFR